jgi:hypothetical protein
MDNPDNLFSYTYNPGRFYFGHLSPNEEEGNSTMENLYAVMGASSLKHKTYEEAEKQAKRCTSNAQTDYVIVQAIARTQTPVPEIVVVKL